MDEGILTINSNEPDYTANKLEPLYSEIDNLFDDLQKIISKNDKNTSVKSNFKAQTTEEEIQQINNEVVYEENTDIVEQKSQYINTLEQDRMQKIKQKNVLLGLQREKIDLLTSGKSYSRNLDEGVVMNTTLKEHSHVEHTESNIQPKDTVLEEAIVNVLPSSEEFEEEFLNLSSQTTADYLKDRNQSDTDQHEQQDDQEIALEDDEFIDLQKIDDISSFPNHMNQKLNLPKGYISEDEIESNIQDITEHDDIEHRILTIASSIDKHDGSDVSLMRDIERRIQRAAIFDRKAIDLKPKKTARKVNKLKAKFRNR